MSQMVPVTPNDPGYRAKMAMMGQPEGYGIQNVIEEEDPSSVQTIVGVILDGSADCQHPDLIDVCLPQYARNFTNEESYLDSNPHGIQITGLIGGKPNNNLSVAGMGGLHARLKLVIDKVVTSNDVSNSNSLRQGMEHALHLKRVEGLNVKFVYTSVTTLGDSNKTESLRLIRELAKEGIALVCAAGHSAMDLDNAPIKQYPAAYAATEPNVLAVAGVDDTGQALITSSPFGIKTVAIGGLGQNIQVNDPTDPTHKNTAAASGTSPASALVTAVAGTVCAYRRPHSMPKAKRRVLLSGQGNIPGVQYGLANLERALGSFPVRLLTTGNNRLWALESITQRVDPVANTPLFDPVEGRGRLMLLLENVDEPLTLGEVSVRLQDSTGQTVNVSTDCKTSSYCLESVGELPGWFSWITQVNIKLPPIPQEFAPGETKVTVVARGHETVGWVTLRAN